MTERTSGKTCGQPRLEDREPEVLCLVGDITNKKTSDLGDPMNERETRLVLRALRQKIDKIKQERDKALAEYENKLESLDRSISLIAEDLDDYGEDTPVEEFPRDGTLPEMIIHTLGSAGIIMQPSDIDSRIRQHVSDLRDNAVAETVSQMFRDDRLARQKYGGQSNYYGLLDWYADDTEDFQDRFKPQTPMM